MGKNEYSAIMVVGPNAASLDALLGNYHGVSSKAVNFVEGITALLVPAPEWNMTWDVIIPIRYISVVYGRQAMLM